jgi:hypothetical protein
MVRTESQSQNYGRRQIQPDDQVLKQVRLLTITGLNSTLKAANIIIKLAKASALT